LAAGDGVTVIAGGGGGYGSPSERAVEEVRMDVVNGYISIDKARQDYGVIIDPEAPVSHSSSLRSS
jgi:N-methylhydantoinase B